MVQTQFGFQSGANNLMGSGINQFGNFQTKQTGVSNVKTTNNSKFPGLTDEEIKRIEEGTKNIENVSDRRIIQNNLYQSMINNKNTQNQMDERYGYTNQMAYDTDSMSDGVNKNISQAKVRYADLANLIKDKKGLNPTASDEEIVSYLVSTTPDGGKLMEDYLNGKSNELLYVNGLADRPTFGEKVKQQVENVVGGAYDSATGLARFVGNNAAKAIGWTAKKLGADEEKVDALVQDYIDYAENEMSGKAIGANEDSGTYKVTKFVGDTAQVLAGEGLLKGTEKGAKLVQALDKAPVRQKMIAGGLEGVGETTLYSIISDQELPDTSELAWGGAIGAAIPGVGWTAKKAKSFIQKGLKKTASKLELSGMLNPAKLTKVKNQLIDEGVDLAQSKADDVGTWMIERGIKGNKNTVINQLDDYAKKAKSLKTELLKTSDNLYDAGVAKKALQNMYDDIAKTPGLESKADDITNLLKKKKYTLSELDNIKSMMDDMYNLYTTAGTETAGLKAEGLRNIRKELRKFIEDKATEEGLGNIKMLNNEIAVSRGLRDGISKKDSADAARELLSIFDKGTIGGLLGGGVGYTVGPFDSNTPQGKIGNMIVGALAGKYLFSTQAKTSLAAGLNKLSGGTKKELARYIASEGAEKLSEKTLKAIGKVVEESGIEGITEGVKELLSKSDLARMGIIGLATDNDK